MLLERLGLSNGSLVMFTGHGLIAGVTALPVTFQAANGWRGQI